MVAAGAGGEGVVAEGGADAVDLVGGNADADAGAANEDAAFAFAVGYAATFSPGGEGFCYL